ncbi:MAG: DNA polymerase III subunit delta', partial [Mariprofundaceae bacterium]
MTKGGQAIEGQADRLPVLGHARVQQHFAEAIEGGRLHHAWLLHGMQGIGKRMLADKLAAMLMCEQHSGCGECHACRMLQAGSHPDIYQAGLLEGKRDINIEQIREVLEFLALSGAESDRRIVVLDDAERMNAQAANALLKGLEEPAPGSVLLIVCADIDRLPATIRSRCLLQRCSPLDETEVHDVLAGMDIDATYLELAVLLAEGAPGRVQCLQEKAIAEALMDWRQLTADLSQADIGELEAWIRQHVGSVPHDLIARVLALALYPVLQAGREKADFQASEKLHEALLACLRWPADVIRHGLRPAPSLLANMLSLRTA